MYVCVCVKMRGVVKILNQVLISHSPKSFNHLTVATAAWVSPRVCDWFIQVSSRRTSLKSCMATDPSARRTSTEVIWQEQAGELLVANPKSDIYIEYCRTVSTLAWLRALHPLTVSNVSPERFFSVALGCRKWTRGNEAGRTKSDIAHHSSLEKCAQPWAGEAWGLQKQPSHNLAGSIRAVPRLFWFS